MGETVELTDRSQALSGILSEGTPVQLSTGGRSRRISGGYLNLTKLLLGDFNHDGLVDAADYTVWRDTEGQAVEIGSGADHDFDGFVTANDREVWASQYGASIATMLTLQSQAVPEPSSLGAALLLAALGGVASRPKRLHQALQR